MADLIQIAQDTAAALGAKTLALGEPGCFTDTKELTLGDGATAGGNLVVLNSGETAAPSAAGTTTLTIPANRREHLAKLTAAAGAGAYTRKVVLPTTVRRAWDRCQVLLAMPASVNPTIEFRNATDSGTLLLSVAGAATARELLLTFVFTGAAWEYAKAELPHAIGIGDVASLQAALDAKAPTARTISAAGLATGGGSLAADRTITVPVASQAQAEAGTDNATAMTPLRTAEAIAALAQPLDSDLTAYADAADAAARRALISAAGTGVANTFSTDQTFNGTITFPEVQAGEGNVIIGKGFGTGAYRDELGFRSWSNNNVAFFQNMGTRFSAVTWRDASGNEKGATGFGNVGGPQQLTAGYCYYETSDAFGGGSAPGFGIIQSTTYGGATPFGQYGRMLFDTDGDIEIYTRQNSWWNTASNRILLLNGVSKAATFGGVVQVDGATLTLANDAAVVTGNAGTNGTIKLRQDDQFQIILRYGGVSQGTTNRYHAYGANLADASGGAHLFYSGGMLGSQVVKLAVANDGVKATVPVTLSGTPTITGTTSGYLEMQGSDANASIVLREASNNRNSHYSWGGALTAGQGHRFFTGGAKASQTIKLHIADDLIQAVVPIVLGSSTSGPTLRSGTGSPEGVVTAPVGSLFTRTDGGAAATLYVKESGAGNTGWVAK